VKDINFFYNYAAKHYRQQIIYMFSDINELYSMVNQVFTECIKCEPSCNNQYIINKINWTFFDMYKKEKHKASQRHEAIVDTVNNNLNVIDFDFSGLQRESLLVAMGKLSDEERDIIKRFHLMDETYGEIADRYCVCINTIKRKLSIAYSKLREML